MKFLILFIQMLFVLALQGTVINLVKVFDVGPDLVLIYLVHVALKRGAVFGVFLGFLAGLIQDIYGPLSHLGAGALALSCIGYFVGQLDETFLKLDLVTKLAVLGVAFFARDLIHALAIRMDSSIISTVFLQRSLPEGIYTLIVGTLMFYFIHPGRKAHAS